MQITATPIDVPAQAATVDVGSAYQSLLLAHRELERKLTDAQRTAAEGEHRLLLSMLDVADALDRLIVFAGQSGDPATKTGRTFIDGLESARRILLRNLGKFGVRRLTMIGTIADTEFCAIDSERDDATAESGTVVEELIVGYTHNGKSLRTAVVIVAA